jgi:alpha-1,3-mannosyltransferase
MKITHVARQFFPAIGGVENVVLNLARRQVLLGHQVRVVTLNRLFFDGEKLPARGQVAGIDIQRIPFGGSQRYPLAPGVLGSLRDADLVHVHCVDFFVDFLVLTKFFHRKKIVLHTHGGFFHTKWMIHFKKAYFHLITQAVLKGCEKIFAVSQSDFDAFSKISPNVVLMENGVDVETFSIGEKNITKGRFIYLGRIDRHKRIDHLIRVIAELRRRGLPVFLDVYGPDWKGHLAELQRLSRELGVEDAVQWKGKASEAEILAAFGEAHLFFSASEYEGFGLSAVEAMATGTVCVLNDIEPFRMILGEESRLLVDFSRTAEAADKIVELMNLTPDQYARLAESLKARAGMFSWDRTIQKLESAYRDSV